jgi:hypothetical protein
VVGGVAIGVQVADVLFGQHVIERHSLRLGPGLTLIAALIGLQLYGLGGALVMLALTLGAVAFLRTLTLGHDDAFTAMRAVADVPDLSDALDGAVLIRRRRARSCCDPRRTRPPSAA